MLRNSDTTLEGRLVPILIVIFAIIAALVIVDVAADLNEGTPTAHIALEASIALIALAAVVFLTWKLIGEAREARKHGVQLKQSLQETRAAAEEWRQEAESLLQGLGEQIDRQFAKWKLSPAEKEVALFLLKGYSHRDIAELRQVSDATARQQARAVYRKAGVAGRHDLAGFFLEDLTLPRNATRG